MSPVPIPTDLAHLADAAQRPLHVGSAEVERLLEFWGVTKSGHGMLNKLVSNGRLVPRPALTRKRIYPTDRVLSLYHELLAS